MSDTDPKSPQAPPAASPAPDAPPPRRTVCKRQVGQEGLAPCPFCSNGGDPAACPG